MVGLRKKDNDRSDQKPYYNTVYGHGGKDLPDTYAKRREDSMDNGGNASYYEFPEGAKKLQDLLRDMPWNQANIFKAAYRGDKKGNGGTPRENWVYNLEKIIYFARDELDIIYASMKKEAMENDTD